MRNPPSSESPASSTASSSGVTTRDELDDTPPILGSWRNIYAFVLGTLAVVIVLFWLITEAYA